MRLCPSAIVLCCAISVGCGTTKWTDTSRTATEQLLISDAMDRAVNRLEFRAVAGKKVYLDSSPLSGVTDSAYLVSLMRQHMLAEGCLLMDSREKADYVVEVRAGAVGTDRREVMLGVPATNASGVVPLPGVPSNLPEMPLATKTEQRAVAKIAVFAYNRRTGRPVWQSGAVPVESKTKDIWLLGAGPFRRGTIHDGMEFDGQKIEIPLITPGKKENRKLGELAVADQAFFFEPQEQLAQEDPRPEPKAAASEAGAQLAEQPPPAPEDVIHAGHTAPRPAPLPDSPPQPIVDAEPSLEMAPLILTLPDSPWPQSQPAAPLPPSAPAADGD